MVNIKLLLLLFLIFPLRIETALAQTTQPRQTPTQTTTKPIKKTPTSPTLKPVTPVDNSVETPTGEETEEPVEPEEAEQRANDLDNKISPKNQNPFSKPDIDKLLTNQFNDDMWRIMRGGLPCLETTSSCLEQLQNKSVK